MDSEVTLLTAFHEGRCALEPESVVHSAIGGVIATAGHQVADSRMSLAKVPRPLALMDMVNDLGLGDRHQFNLKSGRMHIVSLTPLSKALPTPLNKLGN